jgi:hypothetical protein
MNCLEKYNLSSGEAEMSMELTSTNMVDESEDIRYTTYGLRVLDSAGGVLYSVADIDTCEGFVRRFVEFCADSDVALIHIPDLLEDYLAAR